MKKLLLVLILALLIPLALAQDFTYNGRETFFVEKNTETYEEIKIVYSGNIYKTLNVNCNGDLCQYIAISSTQDFFPEFIIYYPLQINVPQGGRYSAILSFEEESIEILVITEENIFSEIGNFLLSKKTINSPLNDKDLSFPRYWLYVSLILILTFALWGILYMIIDSNLWSFIIAFGLSLIMNALLIMKGVLI